MAQDTPPRSMRTFTIIWVGQLISVIGVGPGRGIGLLYLVLGALLWLAVVAAYLNPRIRHIEAKVPDAIGEEAAAL